ncbi:hypothetical protein RN346_06115 [Halomonas sp. PAMB 3232]|uniref:hypothetical protein n=1 Tax=Halomonas sp. PAMB 3232 TaxID=3075221 RepID=UPI0028A14CB4|nr:hypothetical protein [Halomonas sp. PAMB 3232]WNL40136.1 hypothetical protein RN346_06115 [Halomonas sp. PAMB 3232]
MEFDDLMVIFLALTAVLYTFMATYIAGYESRMQVIMTQLLEEDAKPLPAISPVLEKILKNDKIKERVKYDRRGHLIEIYQLLQQKRSRVRKVCAMALLIFLTVLVSIFFFEIMN